MSDDSILDPRYEQPTIRVPDEDMDEMAQMYAEEMWRLAEPVREWLAARRRGEGDPSAGDNLGMDLTNLIAECGRSVRLMKRDDFDHLEGYKAVQKTHARLQKLREEFWDQLSEDESSGAASSGGS